jgi:hypothetical protein
MSGFKPFNPIERATFIWHFWHKLLDENGFCDRRRVLIFQAHGAEIATGRFVNSRSVSESELLPHSNPKGLLVEEPVFFGISLIFGAAKPVRNGLNLESGCPICPGECHKAGQWPVNSNTLATA